MNHHQLSAAAIRDIWASTSAPRDHRWHVQLHHGASGQTLQRGEGDGRSLYRLGSVKLIEPIDSICLSGAHQRHPVGRRKCPLSASATIWLMDMLRREPVERRCRKTAIVEWLEGPMHGQMVRVRCGVSMLSGWYHMALNQSTHLRGAARVSRKGAAVDNTGYLKVI